ncbi:MAG: putative ABC exporter domain-containing protein [Thermoanaerobaculia bacterium]
MTAVLVELALRQVRGRLWRWLRLLRQPRYLVGTIFGLLYFTWFVVRPGRRVRIASLAPWLEQYGEAVQVAGAVLLAVAVSIAWLLLAAKPKLPLTEAEILTLTTAPLTRRQVLRYAVIKSQLGVLLSVLILSVLTARSGRLHLLPAYWALITLMDLHFKAVGLTKASVADQARPRRLTTILVGSGILVGFWTILGIELAEVWQALTAMLRGGGSLETMLTTLAGSFKTGPAAVLLAPFQWLPSLFVGGGLAWIGVAVLLVLHDQWIVSSPVRMEEPALAHARRRAEREQNRRRPNYRGASSRKRRKVPFPLRPRGVPETAIYWKNLMLTGRSPFRWFARLTLGAPVAAAIAAVFGIGASSFAVLLFVGGSIYAAALFMGGLIFRHDLRNDLRHVEVLKSWPVSGWRLAVAEVLTPVTRSLLMAVVGLAVVTAGGVGAVVAHSSSPIEFSSPRLFEFAALGFSLLPLVFAAAAYAASFQNLLAMTFPAWAVIAARSPQRGPAATGLALLVGLGHFLAMLIGSVLPALTAGAVFFALRLLGRSLALWELPILGLAAAVVLLIEAALVLAWVGKLWDDLDPAQELLDG